MTTSKRWTYGQMTREAERLIVRHMSKETDNNVSRCMAMGVHQLWYSLTVGWQEDGDSERLERLINPRSQQPPA
ncbi:hypothetical protein PPGU16_84620 (plasmid) [Paraburkholderia largidicola]|uniref:Uncharacterized protein n=1 Tax=Paraburkholderia largidicola TaxID=3014751 RepID=A0A7I8C491_9BURK|nr:hypothetical protein PPGU16_84620 [Paraburkholderia sp. PGU16]